VIALFLTRRKDIVSDRHRLELARLETRLQGSQEERNHLRKQLEKVQEKQYGGGGGSEGEVENRVGIRFEEGDFRCWR
jgi:hypothetical protein